MGRASIVRVVVAVLLAVMWVELSAAWKAVGATGGQWHVVAPVRTPPVLYRPAGIGVDAAEHVYVADSAAGAVQELSPTGRPVRRWTMAGNHPLERPNTLALSRRGTVYVGDVGTGLLSAFTGLGRFLRSWRVQPASTYGGFPIAVDGGGTVWALAGMQVQVFTGAGRRVRRWTVSLHGKLPSFPGSLCYSGKRCQGDLTTIPLGIAVYADRVFVLVQARTCVGGGKGTCDSYEYLQAWSRVGRFEREWRIDSQVPGFAVLSPAGLAVDERGDMLAAVGSDLLAVSQTTGMVTPLAWYPPSWPNRPPFYSGVPEITGIGLDGAERVLLTVGVMGIVQRISPSGRTLATWGNGTSGAVSSPEGISVDSSGALYVADSGDKAVKKLAPSGRTLATWPVERFPNTVAVTRSGDVYVGSTQGSTSVVQVFSPQGAVLHEWTVTGRTDNQALSRAGALSLAVVGDGNVYVGELDAERVQEFTPDGRLLETIQEAPGTPVQDFLFPWAIALNPAGHLWVSERGFDQIVEYGAGGKEIGSITVRGIPNGYSSWATAMSFDPNGQLWAVIGTWVVKLSADGKIVTSWTASGVTPGTFLAPAGIATDAAGRVYVTDRWNNWIQRLTP